jgi:colicin import membrane protein
MRTGIAISTVAHVTLLAWGMVSFVAVPLTTAQPDSLPVDIVSENEYSQVMRGIKNAPKAPAPKPVVEKIAEAKAPEEITSKITEKQEIVPTASEPPPPVPEPKPKQAEAKPAPPPEPDVKPDKAQKKEPPKPDPIAEALKKDEAREKAEAKNERKPAPLPPKKPAPPKFDPAKIAALLDKRDAQRHAATGETLNSRATLGLASANSASLSQNELDALRARLRECWSVPVGVTEARDLIVSVRITFKRDGSLSSEPSVLNQGAQPVFQVAAESALRAVRRCAPYDFLPAAKYDAWKDIIVDFDPRDMFRG